MLMTGAAVPPSEIVSDTLFSTGASLTLVKLTEPAMVLLRLLAAAPSLAWIEKLGAASPPSCRNRTWLARKCAVEEMGAVVQVPRSVEGRNVPPATPEPV